MSSFSRARSVHASCLILILIGSVLILGFSHNPAHAQSSSTSEKTKQASIPAYVLAAIKPKQETPVQKLEVISVKSGNEINGFPDKILIRNTGSVTADNIRIMLSSEIYKNFRLSKYMINSIEPQSSVTITLEHTGGQNRDVLGNPVGYKGEVIVMGEHLSPVMLPVNIDTEGPFVKEKSFVMSKVSGMGEPRSIMLSSNGKIFSNSKLSLINSILSKEQKAQYDYEVTTSSGDNVITNHSGELIIKNLSDKELKNVRISLSYLGKAFLPDQKVISSIGPHEQISMNMLPKFDSTYSPKDIKVELLIAPSNDIPIQIPISIVREKQKDNADEFEWSTNSNNIITTAVDKITIKNVGDRAMDSVKIMLNNNLDRMFSLSKDSFQHIDPSKEVTVGFKYNAGDLKIFMQSYKGELSIASEHHKMQSIPISIEWKEVSSNHFTIYARNGNEQAAKQVIDLLESNYEKVTARFGEMKSKTVIYMTNSMDEMKLVNPSGHPYYSYTDDAIFVCSCDDPKYNAVKEFIYRIAINNDAGYYNMKKLTFDKENWLLDGVSSYVAAKMTDTEMVRKYLDAFTVEPTSFQWYGYGSDAKYGAAYTFFEYLTSKYGNNVVDKTLYYLGSGMISNHRCSTLENCSALRAVYDVNGLTLADKRQSLSFNDIVKEWEGYIIEHYGIKDLSTVNQS